MASAFIGLDVRVQLQSGWVLEGRVAHVDTTTQQLSLTNVSTVINGVPQLLPTFQVAGNDIKDLQLLSKSSHKAPPTASVHPNPTVAPPSNLPAAVPFDPAIVSVSRKETHVQLPSTTRSTRLIEQPRERIPYDEDVSTEEIEFQDLNTMQKSLLTAPQLKSKKKQIPKPEQSRPVHQYIPDHGLPKDASPKAKKNIKNNGNASPRRRDVYASDQGSPMPMRSNRKNEWAVNDVSDYSVEFDFQASLAEFNKKQVFEEISKEDTTAPETLLVNLNKKRTSTSKVANKPSHTHGSSLHPQMVKLGVREMILEPHRSGDETGNDGEIDSASISDEEQSVLVSKELARASRVSSSSASGAVKPKKKSILKRIYVKTITGVSVPCLSGVELDAMDRICASESGPNPDQQIENGARSTAMLVLQAVGGSRRLKPGNHNAPPLIVVLAGECRAGAYAIATARQLANHECQVIVCWVGGSDNDVKSIEGQNITPQLEILPSSGATLVTSAADLPTATSQPVDVIIDALLGGRQSIQSVTSEGGRKYKIVEAIRWANGSFAPKLSLEAASGLKGHVLNGHQSLVCIQPKWTLSYGLPLHVLKLVGKEHVGELFLADIGFPKKLIPRVEEAALKEEEVAVAASSDEFSIHGKMKYWPPFGDKFVVGLSLEEEAEPKEAA